MTIEKVIINNYKSFKGEFILPLKEDLNIIVGDNEAGKSTILEAINLGLTGQLNGRSVNYELSPYLFNYEVITEYINHINAGQKCELPKVKIEVFIRAHDDLAEYAGSINSKKEKATGFCLEICFNENYSNEYSEYINNSAGNIKTIPIEYYETKWSSFGSDQSITIRSIPINVSLIDTTAGKHQNGADLYISKIIRDLLDDKEKAELAINHRKLKEVFGDEKSIQAINKKLQAKKGEVTEKVLTLCIDVSARTNWETTLTPHLNDIPFHYIGKGEQNTVKMKLALENDSAKKSNIILIEEPENHLSYTKMNKLINSISEKCKGKQLIITTHSSFVLNKLGLDKLVLLNTNKKITTLSLLDPKTEEYFKKMPGYDTLRVLLSKKPILVEGPSDELIVQKAYFLKYGKMPIEDEIDIIAIRGLSFKRFLEIAIVLNKEITIIIDNDGKSAEQIELNYKEVKGNSKIYYSVDTTCKTLEPQLVKCNSLTTLSNVIGRAFTDEQELTDYMLNNKTDSALKIFETNSNIVIPQYIQDAI